MLSTESSISQKQRIAQKNTHELKNSFQNIAQSHLLGRKKIGEFSKNFEYKIDHNSKIKIA